MTNRVSPSATINEDCTTLVLTGVDLDVIRRVHYGLESYNREAPGRTDTEAVAQALNKALGAEFRKTE